jgi:hypothetical protein
MNNVNSLQPRFSEDHKKKIADVIGKLRAIPGDESSFIRLEILFYDVLTLARTYGEDVNENGLLAGLKRIQGNEYKHAQEKFNKSRQRVLVIKKFRIAFKKEVSLWSKS